MELKLELKSSDRIKLDDLINQAANTTEPEVITSIFNKMLTIINLVDRPMRLTLDSFQPNQKKMPSRRQTNTNIKDKNAVAVPPIEGPTMDVKELMQLTGLARQTIHNRTCRKAKNLFPFNIIRIGRKLRFPRKAVYEYLEKGDYINSGT